MTRRRNLSPTASRLRYPSASRRCWTVLWLPVQPRTTSLVPVLVLGFSYFRVSIVVGTMVTRSLKGWARSARKRLPAMTWDALRQEVVNLLGQRSRPRSLLDGLSYGTQIASSKSKTYGTRL